jgi:hypothetical protein
MDKTEAGTAASLLIGTLMFGGLGMLMGSGTRSKKGRGAAYGALAGSAVGATFIGTMLVSLNSPWEAASGVPGALSGAHQPRRPLLQERMIFTPKA